MKSSYTITAAAVVCCLLVTSSSATRQETKVRWRLAVMINDANMFYAITLFSVPLFLIVTSVRVCVRSRPTCTVIGAYCVICAFYK